MGCKKGVQKKEAHCYLKREEAAWPILFLKTMALFFAPCFLKPIFWTNFLKVPDPKKTIRPT